MFDPGNPKDGEPFFTLLGRDPAAPHIIRSWAFRRCGHHALAQQEVAKANAVTVHEETQQPGDPQIASAFKIADEMEAYLRREIVKRKNPTPPPRPVPDNDEELELPDSLRRIVED